MSELSLFLPRSKGLSSKVSHQERRFRLTPRLFVRAGQRNSSGDVASQGAHAAYRTTWVWRDSLDGELTLRPAQRVSSQIGILVRLFLVRSEEKSFRSIARLDGRRWLPPRRACALDTWGCNPGTKNTTHQERSANPGEAPGKLTFGLVPRLWKFLGEFLLAIRAHGMTNRHTQPSRAPDRQTKGMTAKVLIATRADHAQLRRRVHGGSC